MEPRSDDTCSLLDNGSFRLLGVEELREDAFKLRGSMEPRSDDPCSLLDNGSFRLLGVKELGEDAFKL
jgi:hypothetical protein